MSLKDVTNDNADNDNVMLRMFTLLSYDINTIAIGSWKKRGKCQIF